MTRVVMVVFALVILAAAGSFALQASLENAGTDVTVTNETVTDTTAGTIVTLNDSNKVGAYYDENVTVRDENRDLMSYGSDYTWFPGNGTLRVESGGALAGDANGTVSYGYQRTSEEQRGLIGVAAVVPRMLGPFLPLLFVLVFFAVLRGLL